VDVQGDDDDFEEDPPSTNNDPRADIPSNPDMPSNEMPKPENNGTESRKTQ
jgi:hypothetical protein